jgi:hypothetical protein
VVAEVITNGIGREREAYVNILAGTKVMEPFQPEEYLAELRALARAAGVPYEDLLLLQYFGDVRRSITGPGSSSLCTSFAILPPNTSGRACLVGRNFDYFDNGVGDFASVIVYYRPRDKIPFVTITWAGIINGWTLLNAKGIVVSNNTVFEGRNSLEGMSTCFLLRCVAERARNLDEGIDLVRKARRSCATSLLVACGNPPDAAIIEFDHEGLAVRRAREGFVGAANSFMELYQQNQEEQGYWGRLGVVAALVRERKGQVNFDDNLAGAEGVPIAGMNLHSATVDATNLRLKVAMGKIPAYKLPYKQFRLTHKGLVAD